MKKVLMGLAALCACFFATAAEPEKAPLKVLVVTGGHGFEEAPFQAIFTEMPGITPTFFVLQDDSEIFEDISDWKYDVVVFYHMTQKISEKRKENFLALLDKGVGFVLLHHSIAAYNDWPEYWKILGARYFLQEAREGDTVYPQSTYAHDMDFKITPTDPNHPVTKGVGTFMVHDETYKGYRMEPGLQILLTTDHEKGQRETGWCHTYRKSRVCFLQPGHGPQIFSQPEYRQLIRQAILWTAEK